MDDNRDKKISPLELKYGLKSYGMNLSDGEVQQVMRNFDRDGNGQIDFDEFIYALRGDLNERRTRLVDMAFQVVDVNGDGVLTVDDLKDSYDLSWHPGVKDGRMTKDQALREFLSQWDRINPDGVVTREEFREYYKVRMMLITLKAVLIVVVH